MERIGASMNICEFPIPARHHEAKFRHVVLEPTEIPDLEFPKIPRKKRGHEFKEFREVVAQQKSTFTSYDFGEKYPMRRASVYLTRLRREGVIVEIGSTSGGGKPLKYYRLA